VDQSTLVPTLNVCEGRGWIRRERGQVDRRVVALHITASGETVLQDFHRQLVAHEASICAGLSDAERKQLLALLAKIAETPAVKNQLDKK
jgi:DNA-binding MarR family transcriptional regulator